MSKTAFLTFIVDEQDCHVGLLSVFVLVAMVWIEENGAEHLVMSSRLQHDAAADVVEVTEDVPTLLHQRLECGF